MMFRRLSGLLLFALLLSPSALAAEPVNILFLGNSYTGRNHLTDLIAELIEAGQPDRTVQVTKIIYGGQTMEVHWKYRSQNWVRLAELTREQQQATCDELQAVIDAGTNDERMPGALKRHQALLPTLDQPHPKWDYVVLQSWRDTDARLDSPYAVYARRFARLIRQQGGRVVLYETTPTTQNAEPLTEKPDPAPAIANARFLAKLADELDALVVPMSLAANRCQTARPDLTLRYVNDGHLNQRLAYLTACTFYAVMFDESPEGLPVDTITDTKVMDPAHPELNPDGGPQTLVLDDDLRLFLQKTAWQSVQAFRRIAAAR